MLIIATLCLALRYYTRRITTARLKIDDHLLLEALVRIILIRVDSRIRRSYLPNLLLRLICDHLGGYVS